MSSEQPKSLKEVAAKEMSQSFQEYAVKNSPRLDLLALVKANPNDIEAWRNFAWHEGRMTNVWMERYIALASDIHNVIAQEVARQLAEREGRALH